MKVTINLGELSRCTNLPKTVPLTRNFDPREILGEATVFPDGITEIKFKDTETMKATMELAVSGQVTSQEGNRILGFSLKEVSMISKPK